MKAAALLLLCCGCAAPPFSSGVAVADITPPVGWRQAGGYHEAISRGVQDPLFAKALVFGQGASRGALVVLDLCSIGREVSDPLRKRASALSGIPVEHIVVSATHTHGGPEYYGVLWDVWREATIEKHGTDIHAKEDYVGRLIERVAQAVAQADRARRPVTVEHGIPRAPGIPFNRRFLMKDGVVKMNPGKGSQEALRAMGPVDEDLPFVLFRDPATKMPLFSLTSFAMHVAVHGGDRFSADFPGRLQAALQESWGRDFISVFAEGAAGDVNHVDVRSEAPQASATEPERIGRALGKAVLEGVPQFKSEAAPAFSASIGRVDVPIRDVTPEETARARQVLSLKWVPQPGFLVMVEAYRILWTEQLRRRDGAAVREEVQVFRLGEELAVVALPHEIFVELGLEIRRRSPFKTTLIVSLANDVDFYVPTRRAFAEGGYEVATSPYLPGGGELLVEEAVRRLNASRGR